MRLFLAPTRRPTDRSAVLFAVAIVVCAHLALFVSLWVSLARS